MKPRTPTSRPASAAAGLLGLSAKMALAQLAPVLMGLYLARVVAGHGELLFSSYTLVNAVNSTFFIAGASFLQSLYFVGGRALGRGERDAYRGAIVAGTVLALALGIGGAAISAAIGPALGLLGMDAGLVASAWPLGLAGAAATLPVLLLVVYRVHAALNGYAGLVSAMSVGGALSTAALATWWLGRGGVRADAALLVVWCTAAVNWLLLGAALLSCRMAGALRLPRTALGAALRTLGPALRNVASIGWPIGAVVLFDSLAALVSSLLVGYYWLPWAPLHMAVLLLVTVMLIGPLGIAQAAVQRVAVLDAQGQLAERNHVATVAIALGLLYSAGTVAAFVLWPAQLAGLLLAPAALAAAAPLVAPVMALGGALLAMQALIVIGAALLRGIGQTRAPMVQAFIGYVVVASGGQVLLGPVLGHALPGIWWGLLAGFGATAIAVLWRCHDAFRLPVARAALAVTPDLSITNPIHPKQEIHT